MRSADSHLPSRERAEIRLAWYLESGMFDSLPCPRCGNSSVSVWFTRPAKNTYRIWYVCEMCDFRTRAQCSERPQQYSEERRHVELENYDRELLGNSAFHGQDEQTP